jgi:hypothetical protein
VNQEAVVAAVIDTLDRLGLRSMLTGSFASNFHGVPRMTQDADLVVELGEAPAMRLAAVLARDFYVSEEAIRDAVRRRGMFNVIHFETGFKIDVVVRKARPFSEEEFRRRVPGMLAGRPVSFASAEDTILSKLEWARAGNSDRQYRDAVGIVSVQGRQLDWVYLEKWAAELGLRDLLDRARSGGSFPDCLK